MKLVRNNKEHDRGAIRAERQQRSSRGSDTYGGIRLNITPVDSLSLKIMEVWSAACQSSVSSNGSRNAK